MAMIDLLQQGQHEFMFSDIVLEILSTYVIPEIKFEV